MQKLLSYYTEFKKFLSRKQWQESLAFFKKYYIWINKQTLRNKILLGGAFSIVVILPVIFLGVLYFRSFSLNKNVHYAFQIIPGSAVAYIEIKDTEAIIEKYRDSKLGKEIQNSSEWQNLFATPDFNNLIPEIHLFEIKTSINIEFSDIPDYFQTAGIAFMPDHSRLIVAKTNLKSKIGIQLLSMFQEQAQIPDASSKASAKEKPSGREEDNSQEVPETFAGEFNSEKIDYSNLSIQKIFSGDSQLYFILMDDYIIASDSLESVKAGIIEASSSSGGLFYGKYGEKNIIDHYDSDDATVLVYMDTKESLSAPLLNLVLESDKAAAVFHFNSEFIPSGKIFALDKNEMKQEKTSSRTSWEHKLPDDFVAGFMIHNKSMEEVYSRTQSLGKNWLEFSEGIAGFKKSSGLELQNSADGFLLAFHGLHSQQNTLIPHFSFVFHSDQYDEKMLQSVFLQKKKFNENHQNKQYVSYSSGSRAFYSPSAYHSNGFMYLSSAREIMKDYISAENGNRPVMSDSIFYQKNDAVKNAHAHLIVNVKNAFQSLLEFYRYGASRSEEYTAATITNDVEPLLLPFKNYSYIHLFFMSEPDHAGEIHFVTD